MRSRAIALPFMAVVIFAVAACSEPAPTVTPVPTPTATPRPVPTATPAPGALPIDASGKRAQTLMATLPYSAKSFLYIDVATIRADSQLKGLTEAAMSAYLGNLATAVPMLDMIQDVAVSLTAPFQVTVGGNFNGTLIAGLMGMSGYPTGEYKAVRFVQINKTPAQGVPNYVGFPGEGKAVLGETQKVVEQAIDVVMDQRALNALSSAEAQRAAAQLQPATVLVMGTAADLQGLLPGIKTLNGSFGGLALLGAGDGNVAATAYMLFATEGDALAAERALASPAAQAGLLSLPGGSQVSNVIVTRNGREVVVKARAPVAALESLLLKQAKP